MIFYFSGTGNSLHVADEVAKSQGELPVLIAKELNQGTLTYHLKRMGYLGSSTPSTRGARQKLSSTSSGKLKFNAKLPMYFQSAPVVAMKEMLHTFCKKLFTQRGLRLTALFHLLCQAITSSEMMSAPMKK